MDPSAPVDEAFEVAVSGASLREPIAPPAREAFRAELRQRFVRGELVSGRNDSEPIARPASTAGGSRPSLRLVVGVLTAAAALVAVTILVPREEQWRLVPNGVNGPIVVGDTTFDVWEPSRVGALFSDGDQLASLDNTLTLALGGELLVQLRPGTELRAPLSGYTVPAGETEAGLELDVATGEIFLMSGPAFDGSEPIYITTPDVRVRMTGTTLGVLAFEGGACVCVAEGSVRVTSMDPEGPCDGCVVGAGFMHYVEGMTLHEVVAIPVEGAPPSPGHTGIQAHVDPLMGFHDRYAAFGG